MKHSRAINLDLLKRELAEKATLLGPLSLNVIYETINDVATRSWHESLVLNGKKSRQSPIAHRLTREDASKGGVNGAKKRWVQYDAESEI